MSGGLTELMLAWRRLFHRPAFLGLASVTLSLGIAATVCAFTLLDALFLQSPPFPAHTHVVVYGERSDDSPMRSASPQFYALTGLPKGAVSRGAAQMPEAVNVTLDGGRWLLRAQRADPGFLPTLGVMPVLGSIDPAGDGVMVSYAFWQQHLGSDPAVLGHSLRINGRPMRICGVLPPAYRFFRDIDLIMPLHVDAGTDDGAANMTAIARLAPDVPVAAFSRTVAAITMANAAALHFDADDLASYGAAPLDELLTFHARATLYLFLACALVVLAIAGINVSNLMLSRALARAHDTAVRAALGAHGWVSWVPALADVFAVTLMAAVIGLPSGAHLVRLFRVYVPDGWRISALPIEAGWRACVMACVVGTAIATLAALAAAVNERVEHLLRAQVITDGHVAAGRAASRARATMILLQCALATALLVLALAAIARWWRLDKVPLGFDTSGAMVVELRPDRYQYPRLDDVAGLFDAFRGPGSTIPGVTAMGFSNHLPVGDGFVMPFIKDDGSTVFIQFALMTPGAPQAMGLRKLSGRWLDDTDRAGSVSVALVNEAYLAAFGGTGPGGVVRPASGSGPVESLRIVGVVGDTRQAGSDSPPDPTVFVPFDQARPPAFTFIREFMPTYAVLRGSMAGAATVDAFRRELGRLAPGMAAGDPTSLRTIGRQATAAPRRDAVLMSVFATTAALLAAVGLFSVQSVEVAQRRHDLAVYGALGAQRGDLLGKVFARGSGMALSGTALGVAVVACLQRWLPHGMVDADAALSAALLMLSMIATALFIPAWRMIRIEPVRALRSV